MASWNLNQRTRIEPVIPALAGVDVVVLQEVSPSAIRALRIDGAYGHAFYSLDLRPPMEGETTARARGCAVLLGPRVSPEGEPSLLEAAPASERTLLLRARLQRHALTLGSFHVVAGSDKKWGPEAKRQNILAIAHWMAATSGTVVVGIDANSPKVDHPQLALNEYWEEGTVEDRLERVLHDPASVRSPDLPRHRLKDAFRRYLDSHPEQLARLAHERPRGPLAVSHFSRGVPRRYDHIFATQDLEPASADYRWIRGASDHALVTASFQIAN